MLAKISETFKKYANGWLVLVLFAGEMLFNAVILPNQQAKIEAASGGVGPIDLQLFYTPEKVYSMVAAYGEAGRASYRTFELTGDIVYPIVYTLFFALLVTWLFQRGFSSDSRMQSLNVVPLGAWLFDLFENLGIVSMLSIYPSTPAVLAWITAIFTLVKWLFAGATIILILIGLAMALKNGFKKQGALNLAKA
ncbi:MAG TPA: hypothetical protein VFQ13_07285 [Anaerolineales bacterium]|nr:hypothetical protein [Anaerolineales bacterium]